MKDEQISIMWNEYKNLLLKTNRHNMDKLIEWLDNSDFKTAPASTKYHDCQPGGLLKHSLQVYYNMYDYQHMINYFDIPEESIIIMSLLHDICKVNCYKTSTRNVKNEQGQWITVPYYTYEEDEPIGHGDKSIMLIYEQGVALSKIERACIRNHMGFSDIEYTPRVSALFSKCPQSMILYFADMQSTYIQGSLDLPQRFKRKLLGRNIVECNNIASRANLEENTYRKDNITYTLAQPDDVVDGVKIINIEDNGNIIKVYSPNCDGLPF